MSEIKFKTKLICVKCHNEQTYQMEMFSFQNPITREKLEAAVGKFNDDADLNCGYKITSVALDSLAKEMGL